MARPEFLTCVNLECQKQCGILAIFCEHCGERLPKAGGGIEFEAMMDAQEACDPMGHALMGIYRRSKFCAMCGVKIPK